MGAYDLLQRKREKLNNGLGLKINEKKKKKSLLIVQRVISLIIVK